MLKLCLRYGALVLLLGTSAAHGEQVSYRFAGTLFDVGAFGSYVSVGDLFTGSFHYESTSLAIPDSIPQAANYDQFAGISFSLNGAEYTFTGNPNGVVQIVDNYRFTDKVYLSAYTAVVGPPLGTNSPSAGAIFLEDSTRTAINGLGLPVAGGLRLADFNVANVLIGFTGGSLQGKLSELTAISAVPESETYKMLFAGLLLLGVVRYSRHGPR